VRFGVRLQMLSNVGQSLDGCSKMCYLKLLRASEVNRGCMQSLAPTNRHWARVVGYGPLSLCQSPSDRSLSPVGVLLIL
jgi:hypothetical protein